MIFCNCQPWIVLLITLLFVFGSYILLLESVIDIGISCFLPTLSFISFVITIISISGSGSNYGFCSLFIVLASLAKAFLFWQRNRFVCNGYLSGSLVSCSNLSSYGLLAITTFLFTRPKLGSV